VEESSTPTIRHLILSCRHQLSSLALVLETDRSPAYGLLSGPVGPLKAAHCAHWAKVELRPGTLIDIGVLQVNETGMAFVMVGLNTLPEIMKGLVP
jgi:hypothetical protein